MVESGRLAELEAENARLVAELAHLAAENAALVERLARLERDASRTSSNSSRPPSADPQAERESRAARRRSQREKNKRDATRRNQGGQPGSPGHNLSRVADPDEIVRHAPEACRGCGAGLDGAPVEGEERRQVFDLPRRRVQVTEHVAERRRCGCGTVTAGAFPAEATAPACWGPAVQAAGLYLLVRQHLPVERTAELLSDLLGAPVSTGWLAGLPARASVGLEPFLDEVARCLAVARVLHVDETGARVAGLKHWFHVASTRMLTLLGVHPKRGKQATDDLGVLPGFGGVMVHDRWAPYWGYDGATHALCGAHLLRDLAAVAELSGQGWAECMAELLARHARYAAQAGDAGLDARQRRVLTKHYGIILADGLAANPEPTDRKRTHLERVGFNLAVALRDHQDEVLRFANEAGVPFDNNQAERDLRMVKLQQKISGCFRTAEGARHFAAVRSYIETGRKHGENPLELLSDLFAGRPWTIPPPALA